MSNRLVRVVHPSQDLPCLPWSSMPKQREFCLFLTLLKGLRHLPPPLLPPGCLLHRCVPSHMLSLASWRCHLAVRSAGMLMRKGDAGRVG